MTHSDYRSPLFSPDLGRRFTQLEIDRMSPQRWIELGITQRVEAKPQPRHEQTPGEEYEASRPPPYMASEAPGIIYVLQAPPLMPVKIGFTRTTVSWRITSLQTGCPYPLKVIAQTKGPPAREREIHTALAAHRLTGEWFDWTPEVQAYVAGLEKEP